MTSAELLERRYRRLLAWYPADYRNTYAEEMLGVLMAASTPDQRQPDLREAASLITSGLRKRLGSTAHRVGSPEWRDAIGVFAIVAPVLLAAQYVRSPLAQLAWWIRLHQDVGVSRTTVVLIICAAVGWLVAAVAATLRWRVVAALVASAMALGQTIQLAAGGFGNPYAVVPSWWQLELAGITAIATIVWAAGPKSPSLPPSPRTLTAVLAAGAAIAAAPLLEAWGWTVQRDGTSPFPEPLGGGVPWGEYFGVGFGSAGLITVVLHIVATITLLIVFLRLSRPIRRRIALLCVPIFTTIVMSKNGLLSTNPRLYPSIWHATPPWIALILVPVLAFIVGLAVLNRYERMLRLMADRRTVT